jgi:type IV pilus assembly protein PilC
VAKYNYQAKDESGRIVEGAAEAVDEKQVASLLKEKHLIPIDIKLHSGTWDLSEAWSKFQGVSIGEKATFTRQLATMIAAGLPLTEALNILQNQVSSKKMQQILAASLREVESGTQLSVAFSRYPDVFSTIYLALLRAAEASGSMDKVLNRLAEQMEQEREFKGKIKGALLYPLIISVAMVLIGIAMMVLVIPRIAEVYSSVGADLPLPTQVLIFMSGVVQWLLPFMPFIFIGTVLGYRRVKSTPAGGRFFADLSFKLPVFGSLNKMVTFAIMVRTFGALVGSGLPILDALKITRDTVGNNVYGEGLEQASLQVEKGSRLSIPLQANKNFPPILGQMVAIGEETGQLDDVLSKLATYFEQESDQRIKNLTTALEPIMIIVMGIAVAGLALAILLPMFNLVNVIK